MAKYAISLDDDVRDVLLRSVIHGATLQLPEQLDRALYVKVDKVLKAAGGKWQRAAKVHQFPGDPREILNLAVTTGSIVDPRKAQQQFFTPDDLADEVAVAALIPDAGTVLEPSAGDGALARAVRRLRPGAQISCFEQDPQYGASLIHQEFTTQIQDFLAAVPVGRLYDRVVMNPPWTGGQDLKHVKHALSFLKEGGRLVALLPGNFSSKDQLAYAAFRRDVDQNGIFTPLPSGSFKDAGTNVSSQMLVYDK